MRVSIGPGEVAGYLGGLANGFRALGVPCEHFMYIPPHQYGYPSAPHFLERAYTRIEGLHTKGPFGRLAAGVGDKLIRAIALTYAIIRYDVFIFSGLGSFFRFLELPLLRLLGKRVIVVFLGSDARPPYLSGRHLDDNQGRFDVKSVARDTRRLAKQFAWVEKFANVVVNHTATSQFAEREFVRLCALRLPVTFSQRMLDLQICDDHDSKAFTKILHAPSRPVGKGSPEIREVIARLRAEGFAIEFTELSGVPNSEVLRQIVACDFIIDELYSDVPMATFAAEAAMFGKPAVVGSLYASDYVRDNPDDMPPAFFIDPDELETTVRALLLDPDKRRAMGAAAKHFVEEQSSPAAVARRYYRLAKGDIPSEWVADPSHMTYVGGWGLSRANWLRQLRNYIGEVGIAGLCMGRRPGLERAIVDAVQSESGT